MDYVAELGIRALGTRLRRLSKRIHRQRSPVDRRRVMPGRPHHDDVSRLIDGDGVAKAITRGEAGRQGQ